jgi:hypothetical protein
LCWNKDQWQHFAKLGVNNQSASSKYVAREKEVKYSLHEIYLAFSLVPVTNKLLKCSFYFIFIWFVRLLALQPASGDNEDDCGEADGM